MGEHLRRKGVLWTVSDVKRTADGETVFVELVEEPPNLDNHELSPSK